MTKKERRRKSDANKLHMLNIIIMARKTAANLNTHYLDLRI